MTVISNPLLLKKKAAAGGGGDSAYQIEKSLRFNSADTPRLDRTPSTKGNRRTWTYSCWFKFGKLPADVTYGQVLFAGGESDQNQVRIGFEGANYDTGRLQVLGNNSNSSIFKLETNALFRDPGAWYHICVAFDSTDDTSGDRVKVFINGERITSFADETYPSQNVETHVANTMPQTLGCMQLNTTPSYVWEFDGCLADVHLIDGLALSPAAFGEFDSTGVWNPKAFALPAPNNNTTWSSGLSHTIAGSAGTWSSAAANAFKGIASSDDAYQAVSQLSSGSQDIIITWVPPSNLNDVQTFRVNQYSGTTSANYIIETRVNEESWTRLADLPGFSSGNDGIWHDFSKLIPSTRKITKVEWRRLGAPNTSGVNVGSIEVNGVILVDGQTDPTTRNNPNNGTTWSSNTCSGTPYSGQAFTSAFDGLSTTYVHSEYPGVLKWVPPSTITGKLRCLIACGAHGGSVTGNFDFKINGVSKFDNSTFPNNASAWVNFGEVSIADDGDGIEWGSQTGGNWMAMRIIEIDGHALLDDSTDNSFHLKFNDTSLNRYLGKDTLNGKIADATGGLPIYNTTDDYGDVKGSGYRADSSAGTTSGAGLVLAIPGDSVASGTCDVHQQVNTGSSNKTVTTSGTVVSTDQSIFYGSALKFDGSNDHLEFADSADFDLAGGNFTIEAWLHPTASPSQPVIIGQWVNPYHWCLQLSNDSNRKLRFLTNDNAALTDRVSTGAGLTLNEWNHIAVVRNSNTIKFYLNGVENYSVAYSNTINNGSENLSIGALTSGAQAFAGYMQDIRIYKGTAKYTAPFKPPTRNDFTVNNIHTINDATYQPLLTFQDSTFKDNSRNNHTITAVNSAAMITATDSPPTGISYALQSDGSANKYITVPNEGFDLSGNFTIEFWMNRSGGDTDWRALVSPNANEGGFFGFTQTTKIGFGRSGVAWDGMSGANKVAADTWHHCVYVRKGTTLSAYVDGTREIHSTSNAHDYSITGDTVAIGGGENNMVATAQWSNFRVTTEARYDPSIATLTVPTPPLAENLTSDIDTLTDTPTNYGTDTGAGGEVRGNYCTLNPVDNGGLALSQGNLAWTDQSTAGWDSCKGTMFFSTGKWYWEMTMGTWNGSGAPFLIGVADNGMAVTGTELGQNNNSWGFLPTGQKRHNSSTSSHGSAFATGNVIQIALDLSGGLGSGKLWVGINGTWQNSGNPATGANAAWTDIGDNGAVAPAVANAGGNTSGAYHMNFGQRAYKYTVPSGFKSLCTQNLSDTFDGEDAEIVNNPSKYFDILTYTGTGTTSQDVLGLGFQPDLVWIKNRSAVGTHNVFDAVRGNTKRLFTNLNQAENTNANIFDFKATGIEVTEDSGVTNDTNDEDATFVAWSWDAGTGGQANTNGSINVSSPDQWVNTTAGFSITKYTGTGANATVGHGLGAKPDLIVFKRTNNTENWNSYHSGLTATKLIALNSANAASDTDDFQDTEPTNDVFSIGTGSGNNGNGDTYIAYAWTAIPGYSAFGKATGNGSTDGVFVYTGFKPRYILWKGTNETSSWGIIDTARSPYNVADDLLVTEENSAEDTGNSNWARDILSNGFKMRGSHGSVNGNGDTYIYAAWAEHPFKLSRAH